MRRERKLKEAKELKNMYCYDYKNPFEIAQKSNFFNILN
jgi:hypothetical protein